MQSTDVFNLSNDTFDNKTDTMVASMLKSVNKNTLGSEASSINDIGNTLGDSLGFSVTGAAIHKQAVIETPLAVIDEDKDDNSQISSKKGKPDEDRKKDFDHEDFKDDIDRYEDIDLNTVSVDSSNQDSKKRKQRKPILSQNEIKSIREEKNDEDIENKRKVQELANKWRQLIELGEYDRDEFKHVITESGLFESAEMLDITTKQGFNGFVETQMLKFHPNYDFVQDKMVNSDFNSSFELARYFEDECPHIDEIYYYSKYVVISSKMEKEIPLLLDNHIPHPVGGMKIQKFWNFFLNIYIPYPLNFLLLKYEINNYHKIIHIIFSFSLVLLYLSFT